MAIKKSATCMFKCTPEDRRRIEAAAEAVSLPVAAFVRMVVMKHVGENE